MVVTIALSIGKIFTHSLSFRVTTEWLQCSLHLFWVHFVYWANLSINQAWVFHIPSIYPYIRWGKDENMGDMRLCTHAIYLGLLVLLRLDPRCTISILQWIIAASTQSDDDFMGYQNGHICIGAILGFNPSYQSGSQKTRWGQLLRGYLLPGREETFAAYSHIKELLIF